jgi:hypothetical protein
MAAADLDLDIVQNAVNEFTSQAEIFRRATQRKTAQICFESRSMIESRRRIRFGRMVHGENVQEHQAVRKERGFTPGHPAAQRADGDPVQYSSS